MVDRSSIGAPQCDAATLSTTNTRRIAPGCASEGQLCHHQPVSRGRPANFHESRDTSSEDSDFERVVAGFLAEGLHTRRGLTPEEYIALCRRAGDECHASPALPFKA